jgi:hypothetical protein
MRWLRDSFEINVVSGRLTTEKAQSRTEVEAAPCLKRSMVRDGPRLIVSSARRKARARPSFARFQTSQEGLMEAR